MRRTQTRNAAARQTRREDGEKRNAVWQGLTPTEQLRCLDGRLGKGLGAKRQRAKIDKALNPPAKPVVITGPVMPVEATVTETKGKFASKSQERRYNQIRAAREAAKAKKSKKG